MPGFQIKMQFLRRRNHIVGCIHGSGRTDFIVIPPTEPTGHIQQAGKVCRIIIAYRFKLLFIGSTVIIEIMGPTASTLLEECFVVA